MKTNIEIYNIKIVQGILLTDGNANLEYNCFPKMMCKGGFGMNYTMSYGKVPSYIYIRNR